MSLFKRNEKEKKPSMKDFEALLESLVSGRGHGQGVPEEGRKYFNDTDVPELFRLSSVDTATRKALENGGEEDPDKQLAFLTSKRALWLFIEEKFPETREGQWTLCLSGVHPYVYQPKTR